MGNQVKHSLLILSIFIVEKADSTHAPNPCELTKTSETSSLLGIHSHGETTRITQNTVDLAVWAYDGHVDFVPPFIPC